MWNNNRSLQLSKVCTALAGAALAAVLAGGPWLVSWLIRTSANAWQWQYGLFLATLYGGGTVAALLLFWLFRLLHRIGGGSVFDAANVALLRRISWCCFAGAAAGVLSGLYYLPWALVGLAAAFAGLVVRVVKNVFAQALALKEENDFTI